MYLILRAVVNVLLNLFTHREYVGLGNIPTEPPYILVTNHLSVFDSPLLLVVCPHTVRAFAAAKHKRNPIYAPLLTIMGSIWVRRGEADRQALRKALDVLKRGEVLGMSPEGTRSRGTYALQKGRTCAADNQPTILRPPHPPSLTRLFPLCYVASDLTDFRGQAPGGRDHFQTPHSRGQLAGPEQSRSGGGRGPSS